MRQGSFPSFQTHHRRGITLLEVLASIAIISVMLSLMIPALHATRSEARVGQCQSNLKVIAVTAGMYSADNAASPMEGRPTQPWHLGFNPPGGSVSLITEYIYGGFQTSIPDPDFGDDTDYASVPTEYRPFNKYIAPGISGKDPLRQYVCPDDTSTYSLEVGGTGAWPIVDTRHASWERLGNSYAINWWWVEGAPGSFDIYGDLNKFHRYGSAMLSQKVGASASKFVLFMENAMNAFMYDARPPSGYYGQSMIQVLGPGWHGRNSTYSMAMWDGHVEYRFIDTRYTSDYGYEIWPEPTTLWPPLR